MSNTMFYFQGEPNSNSLGYGSYITSPTTQGETTDLVALQNEVIGRLVGLARALYADEAYADTHEIMIVGLKEVVLTENSSVSKFHEIIEELKKNKLLLTPDCAMCGMCTRTHDYQMESFWNDTKETRSLKFLLLLGLQTLATFAHESMLLGKENKKINDFFYKGMFAFGEDWSFEYLLPVLKELGAMIFCGMELSQSETIKQLYSILKGETVQKQQQTFHWESPESVGIFLALLALGKEVSISKSLPPFLCEQTLMELKEHFSIQIME